MPSRPMMPTSMLCPPLATTEAIPLSREVDVLDALVSLCHMLPHGKINRLQVRLKQPEVRFGQA